MARNIVDEFCNDVIGNWFIPAKVLISRATIAGPALAYWLYRFGFDVTVVERADAVRSGGYDRRAWHGNQRSRVHGPASTVTRRPIRAAEPRPIGVSTYRVIRELPAPVRNDAIAMDELEALCFEGQRPLSRAATTCAQQAVYVL